MDYTTAITFALFLVASCGLAWAFFVTIAKVASAIVYSSRSTPFTYDFTPQIWTGCACFTYVMGYIFIF